MFFSLTPQTLPPHLAIQLGRFQQVADGIDDNMTFASIDLFTCVKASVAPSFRSFDTLAVDHTCTGFLVASLLLTVLLP